MEQGDGSQMFLLLSGKMNLVLERAGILPSCLSLHWDQSSGQNRQAEP